jgi:hypothetical protein
MYHTYIYIGLFDQFVRLILEDLEETKRQDMIERTWTKIEVANLLIKYLWKFPPPHPSLKESPPMGRFPKILLRGRGPRLRLRIY